MQETHETTCYMCGAPVVAVEDDETPRCDTCQGVWVELQLTHSIMSGEMDHLIPELNEASGDGE